LKPLKKGAGFLGATHSTLFQVVADAHQKQMKPDLKTDKNPVRR